MHADVVAEATSERGELVLRRRASDGALELRVNGVFVMDDRETSTERLLARQTLEALASARQSAAASAWRVVVGGLGLGYTLAEVLADERVGFVLVAEIEPDLVTWHRAGFVPDSPLHPDRPVPVDRVQVDPSDVRAAVPAPVDRVQVEPSDVRAVVAALPAGSVDLILLDVDNGPDFLVYDENAAVYESPFLWSCRDALTPAGLVAVWSAETSTALTSALESVFGSSRELAVPVTLQSRETTYHLFLAPR